MLYGRKLIYDIKKTEIKIYSDQIIGSRYNIIVTARMTRFTTAVTALTTITTAATTEKGTTEKK